MHRLEENFLADYTHVLSETKNFPVLSKCTKFSYKSPCVFMRVNTVRDGRRLLFQVSDILSILWHMMWLFPVLHGASQASRNNQRATVHIFCVIVVWEFYCKVLPA